MTDYNWTRVKNDINGNSRQVTHFLNLVPDVGGDVVDLYALAVKRANRIGGRKYHTKYFGGGIIFQTTDTRATEAAIEELIAEEK